MTKTNSICKMLTAAAMVLCLLGAILGYISPLAVARAEDEDDIYYYSTDDIVTYTTETFTYARYEEQTGNVNPYFPQYYNNDTTLTNACAPVAGAIVVGYFDRFLLALIPGFTPGYYAGSTYKFYAMSACSTTIQGVISSLYTSMGTNTIQAGTNRAQFRQGLTTYAVNADYEIVYTSVKSGSTVHTVNAMGQLANKHPIVLYCSVYNLCDAAIGATGAYYDTEVHTAKHIVVAYKYRLVRYYDAADNNFRTDFFLGISTGVESTMDGWFYIGHSQSVINYADAVNIYVS